MTSAGVVLGTGRRLSWQAQAWTLGFLCTLALRPVLAVSGSIELSAQTRQVDSGLSLLDSVTTGADGVYSYLLDGSGVTVYILDRGAIQATHTEFKGQGSQQSRASSSSLQLGPTPTSDCNTVVTYAASLVAGVTTGVAKNAAVQSVPWLPCSGLALKQDAVAALDWVADNAVRPAVLLLLASAELGSDSEALRLQQAVERLLASNVTVVAAAGLFGQDECAFFPGSLSAAGAITAGGVDGNLTALAEADHGACIDLYAPGEDIYGASSSNDQAYRLLTGNAPAAAFTAGVAAQLLQQFPEATPAAIKQILLISTASDVVQGLAPGLPNRFLQAPQQAAALDADAVLLASAAPAPAGIAGGTATTAAGSARQGLVAMPAASPDGNVSVSAQLPSMCSGFKAQYYQVVDTTRPLSQTLAGQAPNLTRIDNWLWFPTSDPCAWDLPWPAFALNPMAVFFSGFMYVGPGLAGLYRFQAQTSGSYRLMIDNATVLDSSRVADPCPSAGLPLNEGQLLLSTGYHSIQVEYYQPGNSAAAQGLQLWFALVDVQQTGGQAVVSDAVTWYPMGGSTDLGLGGAQVVFVSSSSPDVQTDAASLPAPGSTASCPISLVGYRSCRCYNCSYTDATCIQNFCDAQPASLNISTASLSSSCPNGKLNPLVFKAGNNYLPYDPSTLLFSVLPAGVEASMAAPALSSIESGSNEQYVTSQLAVSSRVNGYLALSQSEMLQQWNQWHACQAVSSALPAIPTDAPVIAPFPATAPDPPACYPDASTAASPAGADALAVNVTVTLMLAGETLSTFTPARQALYIKALASTAQVAASSIQIMSIAPVSLQVVAGRHLLQMYLQVVSVILTSSPHMTIVNLYAADTSGGLAASLQQYGQLVYVPQSVSPVQGNPSPYNIPTSIESATSGAAGVGTIAGSSPSTVGSGSGGGSSPSPTGGGTGKLSNKAFIALTVMVGVAVVGIGVVAGVLVRSRMGPRGQALQSPSPSIAGLTSVLTRRGVQSASRTSVSPLGLRARAHPTLVATAPELAGAPGFTSGSATKPETQYAITADGQRPAESGGASPYDGVRRASGSESVLAALARANSRRQMTVTNPEDLPGSQTELLPRGVSGAQHVINEGSPLSRGVSASRTTSLNADAIPLLNPSSSLVSMKSLPRRGSSQNELHSPYTPTYPLVHARSLGGGSTPKHPRVRFATHSDEVVGPQTLLEHMTSDPDMFDLTVTNSGLSGWASPGRVMGSRHTTTDSKEVEDMYSTLRANFVSILQYQSGRTHDITLPEYCIRNTDLVVGDQIGAGGFGTVFAGTYRGTPVAIKKFNDMGLTERRLQQLNNEAFIMSQLRHPNIVGFYGAVFERPHYAMVLQFCQRGSLYRLLHDDDVDLPWPKRYTMALNIAAGMEYLHDRPPPFGPIIHGDLKSTNLLLDDSENVVICDFGLAKITLGTRSDVSPLNSTALSIAWTAPEVIDDATHIVTQASDVYAYGMVLYELASRHAPFQGLKEGAIIHHVTAGRRPSIPEACPPEFAELIALCWSHQAVDRPSFGWIVQHLQDMLQLDGTTSFL